MESNSSCDDDYILQEFHIQQYNTSQELHYAMKDSGIKTLGCLGNSNANNSNSENDDDVDGDAAYDDENNPHAAAAYDAFQQRNNAAAADAAMMDEDEDYEDTVGMAREEKNPTSDEDDDVDDDVNVGACPVYDAAGKAVVSWIQCDNTGCKKWRKLECADLSAFSNQKWTCAMNPDKTRNSCGHSQEEWSDDGEDESVYTIYKPGEILLGKMSGYPWWPCIVEDDPDFSSFFYLDRKYGGNMVVSYHVTFLGKDVSRAWLTESMVQKFRGNEALDEIAQLSGSRKSSSKALAAVVREAKAALKLPVERRIARYGFVGRYKGKHSAGKPSASSSSEDLATSPSSATTKNNSTKKTTLTKVKKHFKSKKVIKQEVKEEPDDDDDDDDEDDDAGDDDFSGLRKHKNQTRPGSLKRELSSDSSCVQPRSRRNSEYENNNNNNNDDDDETEDYLCSPLNRKISESYSESQETYNEVLGIKEEFDDEVYIEPVVVPSYLPYSKKKSRKNGTFNSNLTSYAPVVKHYPLTR